MIEHMLSITRNKMLIKLLITCVLIYQIYLETGVYTAIALSLIAIFAEGVIIALNNINKSLHSLGGVLDVISGQGKNKTEFFKRVQSVIDEKAKHKSR